MMPGEIDPLDLEEIAGGLVVLGTSIAAAAAVQRLRQENSSLPRFGGEAKTASGRFDRPGKPAIADGGSVDRDSGHRSQRAGKWDWSFSFPRGPHAEPPRRGEWSM